MRPAPLPGAKLPKNVGNFPQILRDCPGSRGRSAPERRHNGRWTAPKGSVICSCTKRAGALGLGGSLNLARRIDYGCRQQVAKPKSVPQHTFAHHDLETLLEARSPGDESVKLPV